MLLLILVVSGVFCFRVMSRRCVMQCKHFHQFILWLSTWTILSVTLPYNIPRDYLWRRKEQNEIYAVPGQWVRPVAPKSQNSYEHTNKFNQPGAHLEYMSSEIDRTFSVTSTNSQFEDYENVPSRPTRCGFVTNDIYETCRSPSAGEAGWVDNDIYGY